MRGRSSGLRRRPPRERVNHDEHAAEGDERHSPDTNALLTFIFTNSKKEAAQGDKGCTEKIRPAGAVDAAYKTTHNECPYGSHRYFRPVDRNSSTPLTNGDSNPSKQNLPQTICLLNT